MKSKGYTIICTKDYRFATSQRMIKLLVKCTSQRRAVELLNKTKLNGFSASNWSLYSFSRYAFTHSPLHKAEELLVCDAKEGIWWRPLDMPATDEDYQEIWSTPLLT